MKSVLLVDDDPIILKIYKDGLARQGFNVSTASDGLAGLKALHANKPDVMVLDLMMPKLSGAEVLKFMRREKKFENLPVIVLSNAYLDPLAYDAASLGTQKGLLKVKCNPATLGAAILEVLEGLPSADNPDHLLAALKTAPPQTTDLDKPALPLASPQSSSPTPPAQRPVEPPPSSESRDYARQDFLNNGPAVSKTLGQLLESLLAARDNREREWRLGDLYRKIHFVTAMAGMIDHHRLAQMAAAFEALLFGMLDDLPRLESSLARTLSMAVGFLQELLGQPPDSRGAPPQNLCALVVDDDRLSNRLVISALRNAQLEARGTGDPETALKWLQEKPYDLVLLDVELPGMDGLQLCQHLRRLPGYDRTPVIYVTLHADFETRSKTALSGGNDLIAKPVRPAELVVKAVMHLLKNPRPN